VRILVVGGGGREHALAWKLAASRRVTRLFCLPGNPGMAELGELVPGAAEDVEAVADAAARLKVDLTVVGPEGPLVRGIGEVFAARGLRLFGPGAAGARLEGSKAWARELMTGCGVPGPDFAVFDEPARARDYLLGRSAAPVVVKADGLAAGKGVVVARDAVEALEALKTIMEDRAFGEAGRRVVVEECLEGEEVSVLALVDGASIRQLAPAQDHKRLLDGDRGPNTGGMGAYSPAPVYAPDTARQVQAQILEPVAQELRKRGVAYRGVLYAGLMLTASGPKVLEFNVRFGDPEAQVVLPRLKTDLTELLEAVLEDRLDAVEVEFSRQAAICVVVASPGYPGSYPSGLPISGLERASRVTGVTLFHAGTARDAAGNLVTAGGRVLGVTALGGSLRLAVERAYEAVAYISFPGMHYRRDIARRALVREGEA